MSHYLLTQAKGQLSILVHTQNTKEILQNADTPAKTKEKLLLLNDILHFANTKLNLQTGNKYTRFYDQKGKKLIHLISACEPLSFQEYTWSYPLLGDLGYKGFFNEKDALDEKWKLLKSGYDVHSGGVAAWSLLGFFPDPVLSSMLNRKEGDLAELIFHELCHTRIYLKNQSTFNENVASAYGKAAAKKYLSVKYGIKSAELLNYEKSLQADTKLNLLMLECLQELENIYKSSHSGKLKTSLKRSVLKKYCVKIHLLNDLTDLQKSKICKNLLLSGNAYLMTFKRYDSAEIYYSKEIKNRFSGNPEQWLEFIRDSVQKQGHFN